ncbi:MAG: hypothetical protein K6357_02080 [Elusimicrobiota bacterium]
MIKTSLLLLFILSNLNAKSFKEFRTNKISPLADTIIEIETQKTKKTHSAISTMAFKKNFFKTFNNNNSSSKKWKIKFNSYGIPKLLSGDKTKKKYYGNIEQIFETFVLENKDMLGIEMKNLRLVTKSEFLGTKHIYYQQYYKHLPVEFSYVKLHITQDNEVSQYNAKYYPDINIDINPNVSIEQAKSIIAQELGFFSISTYSLVIFPDELNNSYYLSWKIKTEGGSGNLNGKWIYYINAKEPKIIFKYDERQYSCTLQEETSGYVMGEVYEISPAPTDQENGPDSWVPKITTPIANQYVFAGSTSVSTTTKENGEYCIDYDTSNNGAKVFMTLMGPYFSVMNFNGKPSIFTNGNITWKTASPSLNISSYNNDSETLYSISPNLTINSGESLAFVGPMFSSFNIGEVDNCGSGIDNDMVYVMDSNKNSVAIWFGKNKSNLFGGLVPDNKYIIKIKSDSSGTGSFNIINSSYMVITNYQGKNYATGSVIWSTANYLTDPDGSSINTFYHLNKIRNFMMKFNSKCGGTGCINLDKKVPVMIDVYGDKLTPDCPQENTMLNAFYDLDHDAIFMGKGINMGSYYKNFGLDGTVIRHEYGHLVMNRIYPIIYFGEFGAITEAIADYFSISSFWDEGKTITVLGNFIGIGEGARRDLKQLSDYPKRMPQDWVGEVHEDGEILSGALYKIRKDSSYSLGIFSSGSYAGLNKADLYIFGALFYFPDNFENFREAVIDICKRIEGTSCEKSKIEDAFNAHGIGAQSVVDLYEPNNGPEYATNISTFSTVYGYIDYQGDEDYYAIPLGEGIFQARLYLPEGYSSGSGFYHAYNMFLFDSYRNYITGASPNIVPSLCYNKDSPVPNSCYTKDSYIDLYYTVSKPQVYYLAITAGINSNYGNGIDFNNTTPYILTYSANSKSIVSAQIKTRKVDEDEIEFTATVPKFEYLEDLTHLTWTEGQEFEFCEYDCIKILDNNLNELSTNYISISYALGETSYNTIDSLGNPVIKGKITFQQYNGKTFSQRYPGAGTIYIKIYVKNHMFDVKNTYIPLGLSNPIYLTANEDKFVTYNNIIDKNNSSMTIKYEAKSLSNVNISVYTATGKFVKKIYSGPIYGKVSFNWDGTDESGNKLASGIYYIKTTGGINKVEKVGIAR